MKSTVSETACAERVLMIFARLPQPGKVKTRLSPPLSLKECAALYGCMLEDLLERLSLPNIRRILFYDDEAGVREWFEERWPGLELHPQRGGDLGVRMESAFGELFGEGCGSVVIVGSDSPDLPLSFIEEAFRLLEEGADAVFGPSDDGGYYLLGLREQRRELFSGIPWSSPETLVRSLERGREAGLDMRLLPEWYDVDTPDDLTRPGLLDPRNGAPRTRKFLAQRVTFSL